MGSLSVWKKWKLIKIVRKRIIIIENKADYEWIDRTMNIEKRNQ